MPLVYLLTNEGIDPGAVAFRYQEGVHGLTAGGQLIQNGHIQIAVHNQRQGPGNGGGGHDQQVGIIAFGAEARALGHAEAVLLVGDHQPQIGEHRGSRQKRMGAHDQIQTALQNGGTNRFLFFLLHGAGQKPHPNPQRGQKLG